MPVVIPANFFQVTLNWRGEIFESGAGATVFGIRYEGANPIDNIASLIRVQVEDEIMPDASNELTLSSVVVINETLGGESVSDTQGDGTYALPPPNVCALVRKVVSARGPRAKGRMYLPGMVGETAIDQYGNIDSGAFNSLQGNLTSFYDALVDLEMPPYLLHNSEGESSVPTPFAISAFQLQPKVATQRRRLR